MQSEEVPCPAEALIPYLIEHIDLWTNTQLTRQIIQFTQQLKNETVQKWLATVKAIINQKAMR